MKRQVWCENQFRDAAASLPARPTRVETGVRDLVAIKGLAENLGRAVDRDLDTGETNVLASKAILMTALDPTHRLGSVARQRLDGAHDVQLAGVISACEPIVFGDLQPPAGGLVTTWTTTTALPSDVPGVVVLDGEVRTRTWITFAIVGGEGPRAYSLPVLTEPAIDPTDEVTLGIQALELALRGRALVRRYCSVLASTGESIGSLPILLGTVRAARLDKATGSILGPRVAPADYPEIIDRLSEITRAEIPFVAQTCTGPAGTFLTPPRWYLEFRTLAGAGAERPNASFGLAGRTGRVAEALMESRPTRGVQILKRVPDVAGVARVSLGAVVTQGTNSQFRARGLSYVSHQGLPTVALTNIEDSEPGIRRLSMAIEGFFGSAKARADCRWRAARFGVRFDIPTHSMASARRVSGLTVMAFAPTVIEKVGSVAA